MADEVTIMELVDLIRSMDAPNIHAQLTSDEIADAIEAHVAQREKVIEATVNWIVAEGNGCPKYHPSRELKTIWCETDCAIHSASECWLEYFTKQVEEADGKTG